MAELTLYGLRSCDTCRAALKALAAAGRTVTVVDVRADGVPAAALAGWLDVLGPGVLVNRRSTTWRGLSEAERALGQTASGAATLLAANPALMKRPVIVADGQVHVGWGPEVRRALL